MKNRYGDEYWFERKGKDVFQVMGNLNYWRYGGKEGTHGVNMDDLGFADPSGGPFLDVGGFVYIDNKTKYHIKKIWANEGGVYLEVE